MEPLTMAVVGSALTNALMQYYTNKQNVELNAQRFAEQTELANTAHQREVADLRAAGLNPILSTGTAGAAVPSQQAAQVESPSLADLGNALSTAKVSNAQVANANQNLLINQPKAEASKVLNDFYKTEKGQAVLEDKAILEAAPKNAFEAGYLAMRRVPDVLGQGKGNKGNNGYQPIDKYFGNNPSSATPTPHNNHYNHSKRTYNFNFMMHNAFRDAYDPRFRNPDGLRLTH